MSLWTNQFHVWWSFDKIPSNLQLRTRKLQGLWFYDTGVFTKANRAGNSFFLFEYVPEGFGILNNSSCHRYWWGFWNIYFSYKKGLQNPSPQKTPQISSVFATSAEDKTHKQFTESGTEGNVLERKMCFDFLNLWFLFLKNWNHPLRRSPSH